MIRATAPLRPGSSSVRPARDRAGGHAGRARGGETGRTGRPCRRLGSFPGRARGVAERDRRRRPTGGITYANPQVEATFGYTPRRAPRPARRDCSSPSGFATATSTTATASSPTRSPGRWASAWTWPAGARTAASSRSRSASSPIETPDGPPGVRDGRRHHRPQGAESAAAPGPEAGVDRAAGRRHRPRLQQHPVRDQRLRRAPRPRTWRRSAARRSTRTALRQRRGDHSAADRAADADRASCWPSAASRSSAPRSSTSTTAVDAIEPMLRRLIGENIRLALRARSRRPGDVRVDPGQLDQILVNLVVNARDAMPDGGTVTIETGNVGVRRAVRARALRGRRPGRTSMLAVSDTGHRAWTARRASTSSSRSSRPRRSGKGTGLGLATIYGIVRQAGGHIWLYSEPGHGLHVQALLPAGRCAGPPRRRRARQTLAASAERHGPGRRGRAVGPRDDDGACSERAGYTVIAGRRRRRGARPCSRPARGRSTSS